MKRLITTYPIFLYLLCIFFVLHGFTENYDFVPVKDALLLTGMYLLAAFLFSLLFWLLYRNFTKANLAAFLVMAIQFFFGTTQDTLKKIAPGSFLVKYSFILPAMLVLFIVALILIKKRKTPLFRVKYYLNTLLLILLCIDCLSLLIKLSKKRSGQQSLPSIFVACDSCQKPDIYFILADEYAGNTALKEQFQFDNSAFLDTLATRNFHTIPNSFSNYNYTPFAMASILNMNYLQLAGANRSKPDLTYSYETIRDNQLLQFLQHHQYQLYNYSIFDFEGQPARTNEGFLAAKIRLITSQTFLHRIDNEIRFNLVSRWKLKSSLKKLTYIYRHNNENIYELTWKLAGQKSSSPRFVYTHLEMPHYPYYYDKNGREQPFENLLEGYQVNKPAYIEYLQYANKKLLALIDHILLSADKPPVIILMGDHGFRHFTQPVESKYYFLNQVSIHLPSKNYSGFNDSLSGVNFFRAFLNNSFHQHLPYLKDSTSYLAD